MYHESMFVYFILALLVPVGFYLFRKNEKRDLIVLSIIFFLFFILLCLRNTFGFLDLPNYYVFFSEIKSESFLSLLKGTHFIKPHSSWNIESGYVWLNWIIAKAGFGFQGILIVQALVVSLSLFLFVKRYSLNPCFAIFFYLCIRGLNDHTYIVRQSFAFAILLFAVPAVLNRKLIRFLLIVALAVLFHRTAISFLLVYPLSYIKVNRKTGIIAIVVTLLVLLVIPILIPLVKYIFTLMQKTSYIDAMGEPDFRQTILLIAAMLVFALFIKPKEKEFSHSDEVMFWLVIISLLFMNLSVYLPILSRVGMSMYFPFSMILVPNAIEMNEDKALTKKVKIALAVCLYVYLIYIVLSQNYSFSFIWEGAESMLIG